ncbi:MAG: hypothetical protein JXR60_04065 [Bacteroidales bacterium]|nr:hypothetical protein [Bacteroidales bacterium]
MLNNSSIHSFSIPVMGIGYTINSAIKVAPLGISSVLSLVDDILIEKMRELHSMEFKLPFQPISTKIEDYRAKRITAYLDMLDDIVKGKLEDVKDSIANKKKELHDYFNLLPNYSKLKEDFISLVDKNVDLKKIKTWLDQNISAGSIDVNIMTKLNKVNYKNGEALPQEHNDAFSALRGFAKSKLESSVVFSAGMNLNLYSYIEKFKDFYPDKDGHIKKKIILKVSDIRSAVVQGQILAKKGLWVSEYRIESGLNCGGHAFATNGLLMGPILESFKTNFQSLKQNTQNLLKEALKAKKQAVPEQDLNLKITAQGGVGTHQEHQFLLDHYNLDSVGWGSPFLLVPEASTIDHNTAELLADAKENDLYLSDISPLGVKFNSLRQNTKDIEKQLLIDIGEPGSNCPKRYLVSNTEFSERSLCTASRAYQKKKIQELDLKRLSSVEYHHQYKKITEKSCICVGLGTTALIANQLDTKIEGSGVSVCPGPNIAYFNKITTLKAMVGHIYGRNNLIDHPRRPHMFMKELKMYVDYFKEKVESLEWPLDKSDSKWLESFEQNMKEGIAYYKDLFTKYSAHYSNIIQDVFEDLHEHEINFNKLTQKISQHQPKTVSILK